MLNNTINTAIQEDADFFERGECVVCYALDRHRNTNHRRQFSKFNKTV